MTRTKVVVDQRGLRELMRSDEIGDQLEELAEPVLEKAQAEAPVDSGAYRDGLHIERTKGEDGVQQAIVIGDTDHDIFVEAETGNLSRALDAIEVHR